MRGWVDRARIDVGQKPGVTTSEREEIKALKKELAEMTLANEVL
jgi:transposase